MIPNKTIEGINLKHSMLEKDLASGKLDKKYLQKNPKNILI